MIEAKDIATDRGSSQNARIIKMLKEFEKEIAKIYETGVITAPVHLRDGNEKYLVNIFKDVKDITERVREIAGKSTDTKHDSDGISKEDLGNILEDLKKQMEQAAKELEFEIAALLRDQMRDIRKVISE